MLLVSRYQINLEKKVNLCHYHEYLPLYAQFTNDSLNLRFELLKAHTDLLVSKTTTDFNKFDSDFILD